MIRVCVNGKRVVAPVVDLSQTEGWVEIEDTSILVMANTIEISNPDQVLEELPDDPEPIKLPTKKLYGQVTIIVEPDELE